MKKNNIDQLNDTIEIQPSERLIEEVENEANLTELEYEYLKKELEAYYARPAASLYDLPKSKQQVPWVKPQITRPKDELYAQLRFYDTIKTREKLTVRQLEEINREVKQIYRELLEIDGQQYFLKYGHEKLRLDKLNRFEDPKNIRFYQRDNDLIYDDTISDYVNISLPIEKWWISQDDLDKHEDYDCQGNMKEFVDVDVKTRSFPYSPDEYLDSIQEDSNKTTNVIETEEEFIDETEVPELVDLPNKDEKKKFKLFHKGKNKDKDGKKDAAKKDDSKNTTPPSTGSTVRRTPPPPPANFGQQANAANNMPPPSPNSFASSLGKQPPRPTPQPGFGPAAPRPSTMPPPKPANLPPQGPSLVNKPPMAPNATMQGKPMTPPPMPAFRSNPSGPKPANQGPQTKQFFDYQNR